jgi:hypothetical protein
MPRVTIRSIAAAKEDRNQLVAKASAKASEFLQQSDRVLVVYSNQTASLYYEGPPPPTKVRA